MKHIYFWYHHMYISPAEQARINRAIREHDYDAFMQFYEWYQLNPLNNPDGWVFFPEISREDFEKITYCECECG